MWWVGPQSPSLQPCGRITIVTSSQHPGKVKQRFCLCVAQRNLCAVAHPRACKQAVANWGCLVSYSLGQHRNHSIFLLSCSKEIDCCSFICCYSPPISADQTNWGSLQGSCWWKEANRCVGVCPFLQGMEEKMILPAVLIKKKKKLISFISFLSKGQCWA